MKENLAIFDLDNTILNGDSDYSWINFLIEKGCVDKEEYEKKINISIINITKEILIMMSGLSLLLQHLKIRNQKI